MLGKNSEIDDEGNSLQELTIKSRYLKGFIGIDNGSTMTKVYKKAGLPMGEKGQERVLSSNESRLVLKTRGYGFDLVAKLITFCVNKGGVGKSSISIFIAKYLASLGFKILFVDTDSQGNATDALELDELGYDISEETLVLYDLFQNPYKHTIKDCILKYSEYLDVMPSTIVNQNVNDGLLLKYEKNSSKIYNKILEPILKDYDYIITDCAPNLGLLNASICSVADMVMLAAHPHKFSKKGVEQTVAMLEGVESSFGIKIPRSLFFNKYCKKKMMTHKTLSEITERYSSMMLNTILSESADIANAIEFNHNFFKKTNYRIETDAGFKAVEYKTSPSEIASLANEIISLPELSLKSNLATIQ